MIYERVDFRWMLNGHPLLRRTVGNRRLVSLSPAGTPTAKTLFFICWQSARRLIPFRRHPGMRCGAIVIGNEGHAYFTTIGVPLFMHQYAHAWMDYRNRRESRGDRIDYFLNSIEATLAHRAFCKNLSQDFPAFASDMWGITASDNAKGYLAWVGPPRDPDLDGTMVPSAAGGSLMFTPELSTAALRVMHEKYGAKIHGKYGFIDAFNPGTGWFDTEVIGINAGIILRSAENLLTGNVWKWFMQNPEIPRAMQKAGLVRYKSKNTSRQRAKFDNPFESRVPRCSPPTYKSETCHEDSLALPFELR